MAGLKVPFSADKIMDLTQHHIDRLLAKLSVWVPLSARFRAELLQNLKFQQVREKQYLSSIGGHVNAAYYSADCWVSESRILKSGKQEVISLFRPGDLFTDLDSFLGGHTSQHLLRVISGTVLLSIDKKTFNRLRYHRETSILLEHCLLQQRQDDLWRLELLGLSDKEKTETYANRFPINFLPAHLSASYLRMTPSHFSKERANYNRKH